MIKRSDDDARHSISCSWPERKSGAGLKRSGILTRKKNFARSLSDLGGRHEDKSGLSQILSSFKENSYSI